MVGEDSGDEASGGVLKVRLSHALLGANTGYLLHRDTKITGAL